jgi:DNA-binding GntR family transcriptional regulator
MKYSMNYPLYYKLKQTILQWIEDEKYHPGDLLPSEKELQEMLILVALQSDWQ